MSQAAYAMTNQQPKGQAFQIRGSLHTLLSLRLISPNDPAFFADLQNKVAHSPDFFRDAPMVLDAGHIATMPPIDLDSFTKRLKAMRINPIGIQNGSDAWNQAAIGAGLAVFPAGKTAEAPSQQPAATPNAAAKAPPATQAGPGLIVTQPVRGGQQIHNEDGDLVVLSTVGNGAEVAAAGNVHIYGALRGRVFAGTNGDEDAMIFCDSMDAELISIAGVHLVNEEIDPGFQKKRVRVHCDGEKLVMAALS